MISIPRNFAEKNPNRESQTISTVVLAAVAAPEKARPRSEENIVDDSRTVVGAGKASEKYGIPASETILRRNMADQADSVVGFVLLAMGFLCQLLSALFMLKPSWQVPIWLGILLLTVAVALSFWWWRQLSGRAVHRIDLLLKRWPRN
jgi:hypothetical protein